MGCEVVLEEWGCASEIKQNLNKIKAAPCKPPEEINFVKGTSYKLAPAEVLSVYSTLPKVRAAQAVVARRAVMGFSDDSDLSDRNKTR